jgi:hypothetical protein
MPFVKCSVDGCSRKLQPILKVDPKDRETWVYRECDECFRPAANNIHWKSRVESFVIDAVGRRKNDFDQQRSLNLESGHALSQIDSPTITPPAIICIILHFKNHRIAEHPAA